VHKIRIEGDLINKSRSSAKPKVAIAS